MEFDIKKKRIVFMNDADAIKYRAKLIASRQIVESVDKINVDERPFLSKESVKKLRQRLVDSETLKLGNGKRKKHTFTLISKGGRS